MYLVNVLKDYIDYLNDVVLTLNNNDFGVFIIIKSTIFFILNSIRLLFIYLVSFKWLTDFIELPATFKYNYVAILEGKNLFKTLLELKVDASIFPFFKNNSLESNPFITGFLNSCFLVAPLSLPHFLSIRALVINGLPPAIISSLGIILGHFVFLSCILFGCEFIIVPFLRFEPLTILLGLALVVNTVFDLVHRPRFTTIDYSEKNLLLKFFGLNFILCWTEQTNIYSYFSNLTVTNVSTLLEAGNDINSFFLNNIFYLSGILIGSFFFAIIFGFLVIQFCNFVSNCISNVTIKLAKRFSHYSSLIIIISLSFTSVPYYGLDYLLTNPLGLIYNDNITLTLRPPRTLYEPDKGIWYNAQPVQEENITFKSVHDDFSFDILYGISNLTDIIETPRYEQYTVDAESFWLNRYPLKMPPIDENGAKVSGPGKETDAIYTQRMALPLMDKYDTKRLSHRIDRVEEKTYRKGNKTTRLAGYKFERKNKIKKREVFTKIFTELFRDDSYFTYRNKYSTKNMTLLVLQRTFRKNYYNNPVYQTFVKLEMHPFLSGQPINYNLNIKDEVNLYKNRLILQNYLNSFRYYKLRVSGRKKRPFANKVYNQQFKGSLCLIRQFNAVNISYQNIKGFKKRKPINKKTINKKTRLTNKKKRLTNKKKVLTNKKKVLTNKKKVLSFDQIQYKRIKNDEKSFIHEEIKSSKYKRYPRYKPRTRKPPHRMVKPRIETLVPTNSSPLYIGWDSNLRKFLIKTSTVPTKLYRSSVSHKTNKVKKILNKFPNYFSFQSWYPKTNKIKRKNNANYILKLPTVKLSKKQISNIKKALELEENKTKTPIPLNPLVRHRSRLKRSKFKFVREKDYAERLLKRLPSYDWYWAKRRSIEAIPQKFDPNYLNLGNHLPTKFDGIAWPGINNKALIKKLAKTFNIKLRKSDPKPINKPKPKGPRPN